LCDCFTRDPNSRRRAQQDAGADGQARKEYVRSYQPATVAQAGVVRNGPFLTMFHDPPY
jgi:hypothetical protein